MKFRTRTAWFLLALVDLMVLGDAQSSGKGVGVEYNGSDLRRDERRLELLGLDSDTFGGIVFQMEGGSLSYTASDGSFEASSTAVPVSPPGYVLVSSMVKIYFEVDDYGNIRREGKGADSLGHNFELSGLLFAPDGSTLDGELLTGDIRDFGYDNSAEMTGGFDTYDFRFKLTGGMLAEDDKTSSLYEGKDLGVIIDSGGSNFNGSFKEDFSGGVAGPIGAIAKKAKGKKAPGDGKKGSTKSPGGGKKSSTKSPGEGKKSSTKSPGGGKKSSTKAPGDGKKSSTKTPGGKKSTKAPTKPPKLRQRL